jgi:nucleotide-binding universal stress UspA family protein
MNNILIPFDYKRKPKAELDLARKIADHEHITVHLLLVLPPFHIRHLRVNTHMTSPAGAMGTIPSIYKKGRHRNRLQALAEKLSSDNVQIKTKIVHDFFKQAVSRYAKKEDIELTILWNRGAYDFHEKVFGNKVEKTIATNRSAVMSVRSSNVPVALNRIVVAVDLMQETQSPGWEIVFKLSGILGARIYLVYVKQEEVDQIELNNKVYAFKKRYDIENFNVYFLNPTNVAKGLIHFARSKDADLLAIATSLSDGIASVFSKSKGKKIVKRSNIPVLSVKR